MHRIAVILFLSFSLATAAHAQDGENAERLAEEGLAKILQALDLLMRTIPQYSAPEVLPNGDIIIRRIHPEEEEPRRGPKEEDDEPSDSTET
jgi:hypothetical protein